MEDLYFEGMVVQQESPKLDTYGPQLSDEDENWEIRTILSKPLGFIKSPTIQGCLRNNFSSTLASSWNDKDYEEMAMKKSKIPQNGGKKISQKKAFLNLQEIMSVGRKVWSLVNRGNDPWALGTEGSKSNVSDETLETIEKEKGPQVPLSVENDSIVMASIPESEDANSELFQGEPHNMPLGAKQYTPENFQNAVQTYNEILISEIFSPKGVQIQEVILDNMLLASELNNINNIKLATEPDDDEDEAPESRPYDPNNPSRSFPKNPAHKAPEPPPKFRKDEWGFPIPDAINPPKEEPSVPIMPIVPTTPIKEPSKDDIDILESTCQQEPKVPSKTGTRVQLSQNLNGKHVKGCFDNFMVPDLSPSTVLEILRPIRDIAKERYYAGLVAGTAAKGCVRTRIQLQPMKGGEHLKGGGFENLSIANMEVAEVVQLVDYQLASHFGVRRGQAEALVKAWQAFIGADDIAESLKEPCKEVLATKSHSVIGNASLGLLGVSYDKKLHVGKVCVCVGALLKVVSIWGNEEEALVEAARLGARVVDIEGYLIPQEEMRAGV